MKKEETSFIAEEESCVLRRALFCLWYDEEVSSV